MHKEKTKLKLKNTSGITLIALIVTIIIILILAAVTLSAINDGGIFQKAKESVSLHIYSQAEEEAKLEGASLVTQRYEQQGITLADSAKQAYTDLKVDLNATKGWIAVSYSESNNAIYVTYKDKNLLKGFKSSEAEIAIFEIDLLNDGSIKPNPDLPPDITPVVPDPNPDIPKDDGDYPTIDKVKWKDGFYDEIDAIERDTEKNESQIKEMIDAEIVNDDGRMIRSGAKRVDDETSKHKVYIWKEYEYNYLDVDSGEDYDGDGHNDTYRQDVTNTILKWWSDSAKVYLPEDSSYLFSPTRRITLYR